MRILLTGGAGFIGSHLAVRLLQDGHSLYILDDLNPFYSPALKQENLDLIRREGNFQFLRGDICDPVLVGRAFDQCAPEAVVHLAGRAGVRPSLLEPLLYQEVNIGGTLQLLEATRRYGVGKFLLASSSSVYGAANSVPFREQDQQLLPLSPYAATKIAAEKLVYTYAHLYGIRTACLRFFTVYGPRQRPDLAIHKFMSLIEAGQTVPFFGDGSMGRDYTYVSDTVEGIVAALHHDCSYDIFNLGNSAPITLNEMVETISACLGRRALLDRLPDQPGDVPITYADLTHSRKVLGYQPRVPFARGIEQMVAWFRERRTDPVRR